MKRNIKILLALAVGTMFGVTSSFASPYGVTIDTSAVSGNTYSLVLNLIDGDGVINNSIALTNFAFGGGGATGSPTLLGGASGTLSTSVALDDSAFLSEFVQSFTAGSEFSFALDLSASFAGGSPDSFTLMFLDAAGLPVATTDPLGADTFLTADLGPAGLISVYAGTDPRNTIGTPRVSTVPEPETISLVVGGLFWLGFVGAARDRGTGRQ